MANPEYISAYSGEEIDNAIASVRPGGTILTALNNKQNALGADALAVLTSGLTAQKVSQYDGYATTKQNVLSSAQLAAVNSGINTTLVAQYTAYATNKQNTISASAQISSDWVYDFITSGGVTTYNTHLFVSAAEKELWNHSLVSPMTNLGDLIVGGEDGVVSRLPMGEAGAVLTASENGVRWTTLAVSIQSINSKSGLSVTLTSEDIGYDSSITHTANSIGATLASLQGAITTINSNPALASGITAALTGKISTNESNISALNESKLSNPSTESAVNGYVLTWNIGSERSEALWMAPAKELPVYSDAPNKYLSVNSTGTGLEWLTFPSSVTSVNEQTGEVLLTGSNLTWTGSEEQTIDAKIVEVIETIAAKQDILDNDQLIVLASGITQQKVTQYDNYAAQIQEKISMPAGGNPGEVLTKTSEGIAWSNIGGSGASGVTSVNNKTGVVVLYGADIEVIAGGDNIVTALERKLSIPDGGTANQMLAIDTPASPGVPATYKWTNPLIEADAHYSAVSANAQAGTAVAEAIAAIVFPEVLQEFDATSELAVSGVAVAGALSTKQNVINADNKLGSNMIDDFGMSRVLVDMNKPEVWDAKQDALVFKSSYDAETNKAATEDDVADALTMHNNDSAAHAEILENYQAKISDTGLLKGTGTSVVTATPYEDYMVGKNYVTISIDRTALTDDEVIKINSSPCECKIGINVGGGNNRLIMCYPSDLTIASGYDSYTDITYYSLDGATSCVINLLTKAINITRN